MSKTVKLSDGEWKLMTLLWERAPRTITELVRALAEDTGWSKHTVITMLGRMKAKGAVRFEAGERARRYYPAVERRRAAVLETESFLRRVYGGSLGLMLNTMVRDRGLSETEVRELYGILREAEGKRNDD